MSTVTFTKNYVFTKILHSLSFCNVIVIYVILFSLLETQQIPCEQLCFLPCAPQLTIRESASARVSGPGATLGVLPAHRG